MARTKGARGKEAYNKCNRELVSDSADREERENNDKYYERFGEVVELSFAHKKAARSKQSNH